MKKSKNSYLLIVFLVFYLILPISPASAISGTTEIITIAYDGTTAYGASSNPDISADGRFVAFTSNSGNLVNGFENHYGDAFVRDRFLGQNEIVSISSDGAVGDGYVIDVAISANGRFVAFSSTATNMVEDDENECKDIFVHDRETNQTERISISSTGEEANNDSFAFDISGDGQMVVFASKADNLVQNDTNGTVDIFVRDRQLGTTKLVSVSTDGTQGNALSAKVAISGDGKFVAFVSTSSVLVENDLNGAADIFVRDLAGGITERVSVNSSGTESNGPSSFPVLSTDGRYIVFASEATNLVSGDTNNLRDIFRHDREQGITVRASIRTDGGQAANRSEDPDISGDGRFIVFYSFANNLVPGDNNGASDIFIRDVDSGTMEQVSKTYLDSNPNRGSYYPAISQDGQSVVFRSMADNIVPVDINYTFDIFYRGPEVVRHDYYFPLTIR